MVDEDSRGNINSSLAGAGSGAGASPLQTAGSSDPNQPGHSRALDSQGHPNSEFVQQDFGFFKTYLTSQLDESSTLLKTQFKTKKIYIV